MGKRDRAETFTYVFRSPRSVRPVRPVNGRRLVVSENPLPSSSHPRKKPKRVERTSSLVRPQPSPQTTVQLDPHSSR